VPEYLLTSISHSLALLAALIGSNCEKVELIGAAHLNTNYRHFLLFVDEVS
jgi:hypothetical protein